MRSTRALWQVAVEAGLAAAGAELEQEAPLGTAELEVPITRADHGYKKYDRTILGRIVPAGASFRAASFEVARLVAGPVLAFG